MAANSICGHCQGMDEILRLSLLETYCLLVCLWTLVLFKLLVAIFVTYAAPTIKLKACQLHELNCCWKCLASIVGNQSLYKWTWPPRL